MRGTAESPNRKAYILLGCAVAISIILSFPMEQRRHVFSSPGAYWINNSCEEVANDLLLGGILQAVLTPLFVFLLPGPGSIFHRTIASSSRSPLLAVAAATRPAISRNPMGKRYSSVSREPASFIAAGCICATVIAIAWWYGLRGYAGLRGECPALYDWDLPVHSFQPDSVADVLHYFIYVSAFSALWIGIIAGGLRLQSARAAEGESGDNESRQFQDFYWVCFLGWAVQYRVNQWFAQGSTHAQQWSMFAILNFLFVTASSFWVLPFILSLWNNKPRTWLHAVFQAFWRGFVILLLTLVTFFWLAWMAFAVLVPALVTWNAFGLAWSLVVGTWRWRALQKQEPATVAR